MRTSLSRTRGFSLIEVMVAMGIFMVGVLGFVGAMVAARGSTSWARRDMDANAIAQDIAAQIELWDFNDARLSPNTASPCFNDPADTAGALLNKPSDSTFGSFRNCAHNDLREGSSYWGGSTAYQTSCTAPYSSLTCFTVQVSKNASTGAVVQDRFFPMWVVREEDSDGNPVTAGSGVRKRIWILVSWLDGNVTPRRIVSYQTKVNRGALR